MSGRQDANTGELAAQIPTVVVDGEAVPASVLSAVFILQRRTDQIANDVYLTATQKVDAYVHAITQAYNAGQVQIQFLGKRLVSLIVVATVLKSGLDIEDIVKIFKRRADGKLVVDKDDPVARQLLTSFDDVVLKLRVGGLTMSEDRVKEAQRALLMMALEAHHGINLIAGVRTKTAGRRVIKDLTALLSDPSVENVEGHLEHVKTNVGALRSEPGRKLQKLLVYTFVQAPSAKEVVDLTTLPVEAVEDEPAAGGGSKGGKKKAALSVDQKLGRGQESALQNGHVGEAVVVQ